MDKHMEVMINCYGMAAAPAAPQMFGNAGREHMEKYGSFQTSVGGYARAALSAFTSGDVWLSFRH